MKILLAIDGSAYSNAAVEELRKRPWPPHSEVKVITATAFPVPVGIGPWGILPDYSVELEKSVRKAAQTAMDDVLLNYRQSRTRP